MRSRPSPLSRRGFLALVPAAVLGARHPAFGQTAAAPSFPEPLLNGLAKFDLAIFYHGDLRGNFGPCG